MAEAQDVKESGLAAYRSTFYSPHERGARATLEVLAVPLHPTTNHSR